MSIEFEGAPYIHRSEMATDDMKIAALRAVNQAIRRYRRPPIDNITKRWKRRFEAEVEEAMDEHDNYTQNDWKCSHMGISELSNEFTEEMSRMLSIERRMTTWIAIAMPIRIRPTSISGTRWLLIGN